MLLWFWLKRAFGVVTPLVSDPDFVVSIEARSFITSADRDFTVAVETRSFTA